MDQTNPSATIKPRMMDKYLIGEFWYDNQPTQERRFIMHDVLTETSLRGHILPK
jgi:hypothetical protein